MKKGKESIFKGASIAELYSKFGVVLILILSLIVGTILSPEFLTGSNLMSVARNVGVYAIIALGMTRLLIGGGVDLSAGSNVAFCSVILAVIYAQTGSTLLAVVVTFAAGMIIGAINGYFASYIGLMPFIVTLSRSGQCRRLPHAADRCTGRNRDHAVRHDPYLARSLSVCHRRQPGGCKRIRYQC